MGNSTVSDFLRCFTYPVEILESEKFFRGKICPETAVTIHKMLDDNNGCYVTHNE